MRRARIILLLSVCAMVGWACLCVIVFRIHTRAQPWTYVCGVVPPLIFWWAMSRCGDVSAIVKRVKAANWLACTECAYPLTRESTRCPECGIEVDPEAAAAMWKESQWGPL